MQRMCSKSDRMQTSPASLPPQSPRRSNGVREMVKSRSVDNGGMSVTQSGDLDEQLIVTPLRKRPTIGSQAGNGQFTSIRHILDGSEFLERQQGMGTSGSMIYNAANIQPTQHFAIQLGLDDDSDASDLRLERGKSRDFSFQSIVNRSGSAALPLSSFENLCLEKGDPSLAPLSDIGPSSQLFNSSFDDISWAESPSKTPRGRSKTTLAGSTKVAAPPTREFSSAFPQFGTSFSDQLDPFSESQHTRSIEQEDSGDPNQTSAASAHGNSDMSSLQNSPKTKHVERHRMLLPPLSLLGDDDAETVRTTSTKTSTSSNQTGTSSQKSISKQAKKGHSSRPGHDQVQKRVDQSATESPRQQRHKRDPSFAVFDFPDAPFQADSSGPKHQSSRRRRSSLHASCTHMLSVDEGCKYSEATTVQQRSEERRPAQQRRRSSLNNLSTFDPSQCAENRALVECSKLTRQSNPRNPCAHVQNLEEAPQTLSSKRAGRSCDKSVSSAESSSSGKESRHKIAVTSGPDHRNGLSNRQQESDQKMSRSPFISGAPIGNRHKGESAIGDQQSLFFSAEQTRRPGQQRRRSSLNNLVSPSTTTGEFAASWSAFGDNSKNTTSQKRETTGPFKSNTIDSSPICASPAGNRSRLNTTPNFIGPAFDADPYCVAHKQYGTASATLVSENFSAPNERKPIKTGASMRMTPTKGKTARRSSLNMAPNGASGRGTSTSTGSSNSGTSMPTGKDSQRTGSTVGSESNRLGRSTSGEGRQLRAVQRRRSSLSHGVPEPAAMATPPLSPTVRDRRHSLTGINTSSVALVTVNTPVEQEIGVVIKPSSTFGDFAHSIVTRKVEWPSFKGRHRKTNV